MIYISVFPSMITRWKCSLPKWHAMNANKDNGNLISYDVILYYDRKTNQFIHANYRICYYLISRVCLSQGSSTKMDTIKYSFVFICLLFTVCWCRSSIWIKYHKGPCSYIRENNRIHARVISMPCYIRNLDHYTNCI